MSTRLSFVVRKNLHFSDIEMLLVEIIYIYIPSNSVSNFWDMVKGTLKRAVDTEMIFKMVNLV